ncbi:hypothetical protein JOB18_003184 [Solea senegalensis]|uniref:Uncharacterized protein n=1 Tax=Solea senegalensis TaxID=28829 RepID=A0AAV6RFB2_SOLSE|nr:hypothetical protein JOB18_003184 [Solea senegalensis]
MQETSRGRGWIRRRERDGKQRRARFPETGSDREVSGPDGGERKVSELLQS